MSNQLDIPELSLALQADRLIEPVIGWGSQCRRAKSRGTVHFYTDDYRFSSLWRKPNRLVETGCQAIIEPNFSIWEQTPRAVAIYQIYRKRWLAQYWGEFGIKVFVDLNVSPSTYDLNFLGVPRGWRSYATHGHTEYLSDILHEYSLACQHAETDKILFVVYGGGKQVGELCQAHNWIWIKERMTRVRETRWRSGVQRAHLQAGTSVEQAGFLDKLLQSIPE